MQSNVLKRPWFEWVGWVIWLATFVIFAQHAMASRRELQPRAEWIGWAVAGLLLAFAAALWGRRIRAARRLELATEPPSAAAAASKAVGE
ncbi:MAG: hypothetical protein NTW86_32445 [Candidatus Sumerlaeota bacterium]|nr:hypothetical protein [Candidatus Sumerlaeota bacterium]